MKKVAFFKSSSLQEVPLPNNTHLKQAITALNVLSLTSEERDMYEGNLKFLRNKFSLLKKFAQRGREEGMEKGIEKGIAKGTLVIAKNMLADNFDIAVIAKITGLSVEQITPLGQ